LVDGDHPLGLNACLLSELAQRRIRQRRILGLPASPGNCPVLDLLASGDGQEATIVTLDHYDGDFPPLHGTMLGMSRRRRNNADAGQRSIRRPPESTFFASGSSRVGDIMGLTALGFPIGVSAPECTEACETAIERIAKHGWMPVFVD